MNTWILAYLLLFTLNGLDMRVEKVEMSDTRFGIVLKLGTFLYTITVIVVTSIYLLVKVVTQS